MDKFQARQGDLLIEEIKARPKKEMNEVARSNDGRLIVAEGEATGHNHELVGEGVMLLEPIGDDTDSIDGRVIIADEPVSLVHDEHDAIDIPAGTFKVTRQREFVVPAPDVSIQHAPQPRYVYD